MKKFKVTRYALTNVEVEREFYDFDGNNIKKVSNEDMWIAKETYNIESRNMDNAIIDVMIAKKSHYVFRGDDQPSDLKVGGYYYRVEELDE